MVLNTFWILCILLNLDRPTSVLRLLFSFYFLNILIFKWTWFESFLLRNHNTWVFALSCKHTASFFTSQSTYPEGLCASLLVSCSGFWTSQKCSNLRLCHRWDLKKQFALSCSSYSFQNNITLIWFPLLVQRAFWCVIFVLGVILVIIGGFVTICATPGISHRLYETGGALFITGGEKKVAKTSNCKWFYSDLGETFTIFLFFPIQVS